MIMQRFLLLTMVMFLSCSTGWGVPYSRQEKVTAEWLKEHWEVTTGDAGDILCRDQKLVITPIHGDIVMNYHFYPLRSSSSRPVFGDFVAEIKLDCGAYKAPFRLGVNFRQKSGVEIEIDPVEHQARLHSFESASSAVSGSWQKIANSSKLDVKIVRRGSTLFWSLNGQNLAAWNGTMPGIFDFTLRVGGNAKFGSLSLDNFGIIPLPGSKVCSAILKRQGKSLEFPNSSGYENVGGEVNGGYLWNAGEDPNINVCISNFENAASKIILKTRILDWHDQVLISLDYNLSLVANEIRQFAVKLPDQRYGFFTLETQLCNADGIPLEAPRHTGFGITSALPQAQLSDSAVMGVHGNPFAKQGIKWVRYWDNGGYALWSQLEPISGQWKWAGLDAYVNKTRAAGMQPLVVLGTTPEWASSDISYVNYCGRGSFSPPRDIADWSRYCGAVAGHLKGRVKHYEIWNEPNGNELGPRGFFFYGSVEQYYELLKAAYIAIKKVDPDALVLAPSGTGHFFPFLDKLLSMGGGKYFDILAIHTYCVPFPPEIGYQFNGEKSYLYRVETSRALMVKYGAKKAIWNTEVGYHDGIETRWAGNFISQDDIAREGMKSSWPNWYPGWSFRPAATTRITAFMVRFGILSLVYDVDKCFIHHRLVDDGGSPYMPAPALAWMNRLLDGAKFSATYRNDPNIQAYGFKLKNDTYCVALWRVEKESLLMNAVAEKKIGKVDSAPVTDNMATQKGLSGKNINEKIEIPCRYFDPEEKVPVRCMPNQKPDEIYDLWGNKIEDLSAIPVAEEPIYLIYNQVPVHFQLSWDWGRRHEYKPTMDNEFRGQICNAGVPPQYPQDINDIRNLKGISLNRVLLSDGTVWTSSNWLDLKRQQAVIMKPGLNPPVQGRLVVYARIGNELSDRNDYTYRLFADGKEVPLMPWKVLPPKEIMRGSGWILFCGYLVSPVMNFQKINELRLQAEQDNSHVIGVWLETTGKAPAFTEEQVSKMPAWDLRQASFSDGMKWNGANWLELGDHQALIIKDDKLPVTGQLVFEVRSGNVVTDFQFGYKLLVDGKEVPLQEGSPLKMIMQGNGWAIVRGYLLTPKIKLRNAEIRFEPQQGNSHIFSVRILGGSGKR